VREQNKDKCPDKYKGQAGYTLTELLVVLLLLSLITAIGPVALQRLLPKIAINSAAQTLQADLQTLRTRALTSGSQGQIRIENGGRSYSLLIAEQPIKRRTLGNAVRIRSLSAEKYGDDDLVITAGAGGRLSGATLLVERGKRNKQIQINPVFGTSEIVSAHVR
jgi:prepilin-type N-terminal cleavage/methylation domain-containing protein